MRKWLFNATQTIHVLIKKPKGYESLSNLSSRSLSPSRLCEFAVWCRGSVYVSARCVWCEVWHLQVRFPFSQPWWMQVMRARISLPRICLTRKTFDSCMQKCLTSTFENSCRAELGQYTSHSPLEQNNTVNRIQFNRITPQIKQLYHLFGDLLRHI